MTDTKTKKQRGAVVEGSPGISTSHLSKLFHRRGSATDVIAIDDVSINVNPGEMVVLLGPSGCGKTTLLRCVAGLESPDSGKIWVDGRSVYDSDASIDVPVNRRDLSIIFQGYALWPHMTVQKNVAYPLRSRGERNSAVINKQVARVLEMVGLDGLQNEYPGTLSGGQQQRVSLARALVADPAVILFDEPLSNVDAKVRGQLREEILAMHRRVGFAALYVTHDQDEALSVGDRIAVLNGGRVVQWGTPEDVYRNPASRYVAEFVGHANSIPVQLGADRGSQVVTTSALGELSVPRAAVAPGVVGSSGYTIIRPEDLGVTTPGSGTVNGIVRSSEFQGSHYGITVDTEANTVLKIETSKSAPPPLVGENIGILIDTERIRVVPE